MTKQATPSRDPVTGEKATDEETDRDRDETEAGRSASDATGINPRDREPIDPKMPNMPPA